jgi:hypothetical protein
LVLPSLVLPSLVLPSLVLPSLVLPTSPQPTAAHASNAALIAILTPRNVSPKGLEAQRSTVRDGAAEDA